MLNRRTEEKQRERRYEDVYIESARSLKVLELSLYKGAVFFYLSDLVSSYLPLVLCPTHSTFLFFSHIKFYLTIIICERNKPRWL